MNEQEAVNLLNNLESFMRETNKQITTLINRTHNLEVDINNIKKSINQNRILVRN